MKDFRDNSLFVQMFIFIDDLSRNYSARYLPKSLLLLLSAGKAEIYFTLIKSAPWCCPFSARGRDFFAQFVIEVRVLLKLLLGIIG